MFIRVKKRKLKTRGYYKKGKRLYREPGITLYAVLVENYRKDGRVHQRHIRALALIRQEQFLFPHVRRAFLEKVAQKLEGLGIETHERENIMARFSKKIAGFSADDSEPDDSLDLGEALARPNTDARGRNKGVVITLY